MVAVFGQGGTSPRVSGFGTVPIPVLSGIPLIGGALFDQSLLIYLIYVLIPVTFFVVFRTPFGLRLRATGEVPEAVDTAGVSVAKMRYYGVALSGLLAALGGVYLSMGLLSAFTENMTGGPGLHSARGLDLRSLEPGRRRRSSPALRVRPGHHLPHGPRSRSHRNFSRCSPTS